MLKDQLNTELLIQQELNLKMNHLEKIFKYPKKKQTVFSQVCLARVFIIFFLILFLKKNNYIFIRFVVNCYFKCWKQT